MCEQALVLFQQIQEQYPDIPVIFITAVDDLDLAVGHIKEGAYDYLLKPLRLGRLKQVIKEALSKHESILEKARRHRALEEQVSRQVYDLEARAREIGSLNRLIQAELLEKPVQREEIRDDLAGAQGGGQRQARLTPSYSSDVNTDGGMRFLAAELHDDTMSDLSSLAIELAFIKRQASAVSPELESRLEEIHHRLKATDRRLREIVQGLYPPALALQGLAPALTSLCGEYSSRTIENPYPLEIEFRTTGFDDDVRLPGELEIALYRITQQRTLNTIHHARARKLSIDLSWSGSEIALSLDDDGIGFDIDNPPEGPDTGHFGLVNPNPPKDTDGRREGSGRGWVRELQGRWPGVLG